MNGEGRRREGGKRKEGVVGGEEGEGGVGGGSIRERENGRGKKDVEEIRERKGK